MQLPLPMSAYHDISRKLVPLDSSPRQRVLAARTLCLRMSELLLSASDLATAPQHKRRLARLGGLTEDLAYQLEAVAEGAR